MGYLLGGFFPPSFLGKIRMIYLYSFKNSNYPKEKMTTKIFSKSDAATAV